jgi:hypothetical protein
MAGDMLEALVGKNFEKVMLEYRLWAAAKTELAERERLVAG